MIDPQKFVQKSKQSHIYYCENALWIITDKMQLVPFKPNQIQRKLDKIVQEEIRKQGYIRAVVLKARREGMSTYIESRAFAHIHLNNYSFSCIMAHESKATSKIFQMSKTFYDYLSPEIKPQTKYYNANELTFENSKVQWKSAMEVFTAGEKHTARSGGYTFFHGSEVAFYPSSEGMTAILPTIKRIPGTEIWFESTANGRDGYFYNTYWDAKNGNSDYRAIFFAWWEFEEYSEKFRNKEELEAFKESVESGRERDRYGDERLERELYELSWEQLKWRRNTIRNDCQNHPRLKPLDVFKQEFPGNEEEAFVSSSGCVFDMGICLLNEKRSIPPVGIGGLRYKTTDEKEVEFYPDPNGYLKIWQMPDKEPFEYRYGAGGDTSMGGVESDFNSLHIIDRVSLHQKKVVCSWHGAIDGAHALAREWHKLWLFYNQDVFFCIELAMNGHAVVKALYDRIGGKYLYRTGRVERVKTKEKRKEADYGFATNTKTKPIIIQELNKWIRDGLFICDDKEFWRECQTFVHGERHSNMVTGAMGALNKGKQGLANRNFDDRVIDMALAIEMDRKLPPARLSQGKEPEWAKRLREERENKGTYMST